MLITLIRAAVMYAVVIFCVRIMGKRQIGQMQPTELVITLLMSNLAALPIEDGEVPILGVISGILLLVSIEIFISIISLKQSKFRKFLQGNSVLIIEDGEIKQNALKELRMTVDDLSEALRIKDVFDISEVAFAFLETNGALSVELKKEKKAVTAMQMKIKEKDSGIPFVIVSDGRKIKENFSKCNITEGRLDNALRQRSLKIEDVLIMTADKEKICTLVAKEDVK